MSNIVLVAIAFTLSGCYLLSVNLNVAAGKPLYLYLDIDKLVEVKLGANVSVTKLPYISR
ncbi:MAG: hypothetical protein ACXWT3_01985 [Methylococcaceae bacterium]